MPKNLKNLGLGTALTASLFGVGCGDRGETQVQQRVPYDKALVLVDITEDARTYLRSGQYNKTNIGLETWFDDNGNGTRDPSEGYTLLFTQSDEQSVKDILREAQGLLDKGRTPLVGVERPNPNNGYVSSTAFSQNPYPVRVGNLPNGREVWHVDDINYVNWIKGSVHSINGANTQQISRYTLSRQQPQKQAAPAPAQAAPKPAPAPAPAQKPTPAPAPTNQAAPATPNNQTDSTLNDNSALIWLRGIYRNTLGTYENTQVIRGQLDPIEKRAREPRSQ